MFYCYKITNQVNNKLYIGITKNFEQRRRQHVNVSTNTTDPQYNHRLYASIRKYGIDLFTFAVIKTMDTWNKIAEYEIYLIDKLDTMNEEIGYNLSKGGEGAYGVVRSEETKTKLRAITKKQMTPEARAHLSRIAKKQMSDPKNREISRQGALKQTNKNLSGLKKYYKENPHMYLENGLKGFCKPKACIYNGIKYYSIAEAARQNNMAETTIRRKVNII